MKRSNKVLAALVCTLFVGACSDDKKETPKATSDCDTLTFENDIKPIVADSGSGACAKCHTDSGITLKFDTLASFTDNKAAALERLQSTSAGLVMPQPHGSHGGLDYKTTTDGKKLITWLSCASPK